MILFVLFFFFIFSFFFFFSMLKLVYGSSLFPVINLALKSQVQMKKLKHLPRAEGWNLERVLICTAKLMSMEKIPILYGITSKTNKVVHSSMQLNGTLPRYISMFTRYDFTDNMTFFCLIS